MASVLVVDDSPLDRAMVEGILTSDRELRVDLAANGVIAVEHIKRSVPDVVVTDLMMPEMDGLQFIETVRNQHPQVPVVVMTCLGTEETAIQALQRGAASFVPKSRLSDRLVDTVRQVLALKRVDHSYRELMQCLSHSVTGFLLESRSTLIPQVVDLVQRALAGAEVCDATECIRLSLALEEALLNALIHGNFELTAAVRQAGFNASAEIVRKRSEEKPYRDRKIAVQLELSTSEVKFVVRDEGPGFDVSALPSTEDITPFEDGCGRGLTLMQSFMDEVVYNDAGNEVTLVKSFVSGHRHRTQE